MSKKHDTIAITLGAAVGAGGSFTANYPAGRSADDYLGGADHILTSLSARTLFSKSGDFSVKPGASNISVTLHAAHAFAAGSKLWLALDRAEITSGAGEPVESVLANPARMAELTMVKLALGTPATASANAIVASQAATAADGLATGINGALAAQGVATLDVPRNVVAAWTNTAILTVIGEDEHGNPMRESSASGTSFTGKKAFKKVTGISVSANVTALTVGTGVVLGLPVFVADVADIMREIQDGAAASAGTPLAGVQTDATATTGDVRGTYSPANAPNGSRVYEIIAAVRAPGYRGVAQFAG